MNRLPLQELSDEDLDHRIMVDERALNYRDQRFSRYGRGSDGRLAARIAARLDELRAERSRRERLPA